MSFCDKCGTYHTPEECPYNPVNAEQNSASLLDGVNVDAIPVGNFMGDLLNVTLQVVTSLPSHASKAAGSVLETAGGVASSAGDGLVAAAEGAAEGLGAVLGGAGDIVGGIAEAAGDILSGL